MDSHPITASILFIATALIAIGWLAYAAKSARFLVLALAWTLLQTALALSGVYQDTLSMPPRIMLFGVFPALAFIIATFATKSGRAFADSIDLKTLTAFHSIRLPVEIVLMMLYIHGSTSVLMTYHGQNFDIISGLTAPIVAIAAFRNGSANRTLLLAWNILCMVLLAVVVATAILATPSPMQRIAFDQPNIAVLHFPFSLLPSVVVPMVFFAHLVAFRRLLTKNQPPPLFAPHHPSSPSSLPPLLLLPLLLFSPLLFPHSAKAQSNDIVFATYTYSTNDRLQNLEPLAEHLSTVTGLPIRAVSYPTVQALIEAVRTGEADFAMMNTSGYLVLQRNHPDAAVPMVNLSLGSESVTNYGGCLIARRELGIRSMSDVAAIDNRIPLALVASTSTSGNLVPRLLLNSHGIADPESKFDVSYSGTHAKVVEDVIGGNAMLGGAGCAEVDKARLSPNFDEQAVVVGSFDDIPLGPVVHHANVDSNTVAMVSTLLLSLHDDNAGVFTNFLQGWSEFLQAKQFVPVSDSDYDPFRRMFGTNQALWKLIE